MCHVAPCNRAPGRPSGRHWAYGRLQSAQVQSPATDEEIEDTLNFQLEELSKMADDELSLIPKMAEWKPWEVPAGMLIAWLRQVLQACMPCPV